MKKIAAGATVGLLALVGCADVEQEEPEPTPEESATAEVASDAGTEVPEQDAEDLEEDDGEDALNERGNLPMPENSPYSLVDMSTDDVVAEIEVSEVNAAVQCTNEYTPEPSGHLLGLDFTVDVDSAVLEIQPDGLWLSSDLFQILDVDGNVVDRDPGSTSPAYSCPSQDDQFPFGNIRPGTTGSGQVVLESSVEAGYIVFHEIQTDEYLEWEFDLT